MAWVAHPLAALYDADGQKLFRSVIVITDRTVLASQTQGTLYRNFLAQAFVFVGADWLA